MRQSIVFPTLIAALAMAGCGKSDSVAPITETRPLDQPRSDPSVALDTKTRMGVGEGHGGFVHPPMGGGMGAGMDGAPAAQPAFAFDLPAGWTEIAPTQMRSPNFAVTGKSKIECYVTVLPGGGGGLAANLNRWRKQMGLADLGDAELAALPRVKVLGADAPLLQIEGKFNGVDGSAMTAVALDRPGAAVFVKMVGPAADVRGETENFKALCASLRDAPAQAAAPAAPTVGGFEQGPFQWTAPAEWTQAPAKQMRVVTFNPKSDPNVECYVTLLGGAAGGLEANVNRWRQQLHLAPLTADAIAKLEAVKVLGRDARFVEVDGGAVGLLGVVCDLGTQTLFVKMTGPMASLRAERERFLAFCRSLS